MSQATLKNWRYDAVGPEGRVQGFMKAMDEVDLDRSLAKEGITLVSAKSIKQTPRKENERMVGNDLVIFTTQLATVLSAGVPIVEGMRDLGVRMRSKASRDVIQDVVKELEAGASLSDALSSRPRSFPLIYRSSVQAGEMSGSMPEVLQRLAAHMEWTRSIRQATTQALVYPAILGLAITGLVITLVTFLVPRIVKMFPGGADELPWQTRQVLEISNFLTGNWLFVLLGGALLATAFVLTLRHPKGRLWLSTRLLEFPRIGEVVRMFATAKFAATAGTLQNAGCSVADVIGLAGVACGNARMAASFQRANDEVQRGASISEALGADGRMDPLLLQMVAVGERAGDLGGCLDKLSEHYDRELPRVVKWMLSFLEPAMIVVGGLVVAYTLLAAFLPLLDMYDKL
ncbi:Putative type II secretion system protein F [Planctomycetes bacterium Poly30]|uniref:Type II secretion system protein F n=1 Tax=Saltatorellus ferox TaxID=2528018 RepID=A0A518ERY6_9BACT|nr:Putative type II secretion system protein F [Planctomycetes bacterium Poly30]